VSLTGRRTRPPDCLSDLQLDQLLVEALPTSAVADARRHIEGCARCNGRLQSFASVSLPLVAAFPKRARRSRQWLFAAAACVPVLALGVVWTQLSSNSHPTPTMGDNVRTKGAVTLAVAARRSGGEVERLTPLETVFPGDSLRFEVAASNPGYLAILSFDSAGAVSPFAPFAGKSQYFAAGPPTFLSETVEADETPGVERILAMMCPASRDVEELKALGAKALSRASGDPLRVHRLDPTCAEAFFDIDKKARP